MSELIHIADPILFQRELERLLLLRRKIKLKKIERKYSLSKGVRRIIHQKTDGRCHICGCEVPLRKFEADHVRVHSSGGLNIADNFLPACRTCNNYRWNYDPDEIKWILKLGIWARMQIIRETPVGNLIANGFVAKEKNRERRRKTPRI